MNELMQADTGGLLVLLERAHTTLASAKSSAEVLEAMNRAGVAYDAAKSAHRLAEATQAQEEVLAAIRKAQRDALLIECSALALFADEYDAAEKRGEVARRGRPKKNVSGENVSLTAADLGVSRKQIMQARRIRDFEAERPGRLEQVLDELLSEGHEPTRARLRRIVSPETARQGRAKSQASRAKAALRGTSSVLDLLRELAEVDVRAAVPSLDDDDCVRELREAIQGAQATLDLLAAAFPPNAEELPRSASHSASEIEVVQ